MKKVHQGQNGTTPCLHRVSAHARHTPPIVVSREKFLALPEERQCAKCRARLIAQDEQGRQFAEAERQIQTGGF